MTYQSIAGPGLIRATPFGFTLDTTIASSFPPVIDATGEKCAFIGPVWFEDNVSSKTIDAIGFRFGAVTKAGGSVVRASLQDMDNTALFRPDGTQDQFRDIAAASITANTWLETGLITSDGTDTGTKRTVSRGDKLCIVFEFDSGGRLGADSFEFACINPGTSNFFILDNSPQGVATNTGSWGTSGRMPNVVLKFSDGTYGTLGTTLPWSAVGTLTYNNGSTPDEQGLEFTVEAKCKIDALIVGSMNASLSSSDFDVVLYDGTTALETISHDATHFSNAYGASFNFLPTLRELTTGTTYRLVVKPTTANSVILQYLDVNSASHRKMYPFGTSGSFCSRTDAGAFSQTTTRIPLGFGIRVVAIDDGAGGGGTTIAGTPMLRGMVS